MKQLALRFLRDERFRFLLTGGFNTVAGYLVFVAIQWGIGRYVSYDGSVIIAQLVTSAVAFVLYRRFVFRVQGNVLIDYLRFQVVYIIPVSINLFVLPVLVLLGWNVYFAQALIAVVSALVSYLGHKYFSFRRANIAPQQQAQDRPEGETSMSEADDRSQPSRSLTIWARVTSTDLGLYLATIVLSGIVTVGALQLWKAKWSTPFRYDSDAVGGGAQIKTTLMTGWYEQQPLLGAPTGQFFHDYYTADDLGPMFAAVARFFTQDWALVQNVYYVLGFFLAAVAAVWFFRLLGVSRLLALILSVLFSIAPYHFYRGENHLWLSAYFPLPIAMGFVYLALVGRPIWGGRPDVPWWRSWLTWRTLAIVVSLWVLATDSSYYAFFTILMIAFAGVIRWLISRDWRRLLGAAVAGVIIVLVMISNMLPDLEYSWANGTNTAAVVRPPGSTEGFSLELAQLILPVPGDRIPGFDRLRAFFDAYNPVSSEDPALGLVAALGLLILLLLAFYFLVRPSRAKLDQASAQYRLRALSTLTLFGLLLSTIGGFASFIGLFTNSLRGWNRMSIILALFSLAAVGIIVDYALRRIWARWDSPIALRRVVLVVGSLLLLSVGFIDQVTPSAVPAYAAVDKEYAADAALVAGISKISGAHAKVVQLPYRDYPESATDTGVPDTEQLKPFLHSDTISWTAGGIKGRPDSEWVGVAQRYGIKALVEGAAAAGFNGVLIDRVALGASAKQTIGALTKYLGAPVVQSSDGRNQYFTLKRASKAVFASHSAATVKTIGADIVHPVIASIQPDLLDDLTAIDVFKHYEPQVLIQNPRSQPVTVKISIPLAYTLGTATLRLSYPGERSHDFAVGPKAKTLTFTLTAAPGRSVIDLQVVSGTPLPTHTPIVPVLSAQTITVEDVRMASLLGARPDTLPSESGSAPTN